MKIYSGNHANAEESMVAKLITPSRNASTLHGDTTMSAIKAVSQHK